MKEDKRLNEVIRVQKRPNNFVMIDKGFLENSSLSWKAKGILAYLLSKPDHWKVIVKDLVNHSTDGKAAVYSGLNELKEHGHYQKMPVRDKDGKRIHHWEGTISEVPMESLDNTAFSLLTDFQEIENQDIDNQDIENRERSNNYLSNNDFSNNECESEEAHTHPQLHGKHKRVRLTPDQCKDLAAAFGETKTQDYIGQLDRFIARTGKDPYPGADGHYAALESWILQDAKKNGAPIQPPKPNRCANFKQREWDFDAITQLEQQNLMGNGGER